MKYNFENIVLSNRYELVEEIGSGGMAFVYKARDIRLSRYVAVKILKTEYTKNKDFVQRFSYEAMSAASITHPNIVSIYDAGYDNELFYIVMELVEGISLKELIDKKKQLKWKDALVIAKQILSALEVAHKNNIIHRDIKPHNIILTYDGAAKVADFGIARVVSSATREVSDFNVGSVHYISPEQAKGESIDERSDIYSLGITLFEMLIGRVPFDGETAVSVAMKNIQEPLIPPREVNPEIPVGVSDFVVKSARKNPNERYQSAVDMMSALQVVMLIPNEHLNYSSNYIKNRNNGVNKKEKRKKNSFSEFIKNNYKESIMASIAIVISIVVFSSSFGGVSKYMADYRMPEYTVIDFTNEKYDDISEKLRKLGINVDYDYERSDSIEKGRIISQTPAVGTSIKPSSNPDAESTPENTITFQVSYGTENFALKDYNGKQFRIIENDFRNTGVNIEIINIYDSNVPKNTVITTRPGNGEILNSGDTLYVYMSEGAPSVLKSVNYVGMTRSQAKKAVEDAGFKCTIKEIAQTENEASETGEGGEPPVTETPKVQAQYPPSDTVMQEGDTVVIYMSPPEQFRTSRNLVIDEGDMNLNSTFNLTIESTPSDTGRTETLINETYDKSVMPYVFKVDVPFKGESIVKVKIDGKAYCTYRVKSD